MTNTRTLIVDRTVPAIFTVTNGTTGEPESLVYVTKSSVAPNGFAVWTEDFDGQNTKCIGTWTHSTFGDRASDLAMSAALQHLGWGELLLTARLDEEKAGA